MYMHLGKHFFSLIFFTRARVIIFECTFLSMLVEDAVSLYDYIVRGH
jgi:hypothetical protein